MHCVFLLTFDNAIVCVNYYYFNRTKMCILAQLDNPPVTRANADGTTPAGIAAVRGHASVARMIERHVQDRLRYLLLLHIRCLFWCAFFVLVCSCAVLIIRAHVRAVWELCGVGVALFACVFLCVHVSECVRPVRYFLAQRRSDLLYKMFVGLSTSTPS